MKMSNAESPRVMMTSITTFKTTRQVTPWAKLHLSGWAILTIGTCHMIIPFPFQVSVFINTVENLMSYNLI